MDFFSRGHHEFRSKSLTCSSSKRLLCSNLASWPIWRCLEHLLKAIIRTVEAGAPNSGGEDMKLSEREVVGFKRLCEGKVDGASLSAPVAVAGNARLQKRQSFSFLGLDTAGGAPSAA